MHPIDHIRRLTTISPEQEERINRLMETCSFRRGETIEGVFLFSKFGFYISKGAARLFYTMKGKEHTLSFHFTDEFVMIPERVIARYGETLAIELLQPTEIITIPHRQVRDIVSGSFEDLSDEAKLFYITAMTKILQNMEERLEIMQLGARERYHRMLERYPMLESVATTTQIASYLGLAKETLYRIKGNKYNPTGKPRAGHDRSR